MGWGLPPSCSFSKHPFFFSVFLGSSVVGKGGPKFRVGSRAANLPTPAANLCSPVSIDFSQTTADVPCHYHDPIPVAKTPLSWRSLRDNSRKLGPHLQVWLGSAPSLGPAWGPCSRVMDILAYTATLRKLRPREGRELVGVS